MRHILLSFVDYGCLELERVEFQHSLLAEPRCSVRGKSEGAWAGCGNFQWTAGVRALALLLLREKARVCDGPVLLGGAGSAASSLDYAISKQPLWLIDMFGLDRNGSCLIRHILARTNPERKRGGSVAISINEAQLARHDIEVRVNDGVVSERGDLIRMAQAIEAAGNCASGPIKMLQRPQSLSRQAGAPTLVVSQEKRRISPGR